MLSLELTVAGKADLAELTLGVAVSIARRLAVPNETAWLGLRIVAVIPSSLGAWRAPRRVAIPPVRTRWRASRGARRQGQWLR